MVLHLYETYFKCRLDDMNHSSVTNLNKKYAEQAVLFIASRENFILGQ